MDRGAALQRGVGADRRSWKCWPASSTRWRIEYLRERKADLEQVVERMLRGLLGAAHAPLDRRRGRATRDFAGEDPLVLVANDSPRPT